MTDSPLSAPDRAVDHALAQLSASMKFLLEITPVNAADVRGGFLDGDVKEPVFTYRELEVEPEVVVEQLSAIDIGSVEDTTLAHLLRAKHREMQLQVEMLRARDSDDFLGLSIELYGGVSPALREQAESLLEAVPSAETRGASLDAEEFLELALAEIGHYREQDREIEMHAEIRPDVNGVMVSGDTLLIGAESAVQRARAEGLLHHEIGTHLVTQVNGAAQPVKVLGAGLAGYDETQEGLAVLAEVACGGLTAFRLRQLAGRVVTVHRLVAGASFSQAHGALLEAGFPRGSAFNTVMRVYRAGGMTKDAIYLRGLLDLLAHLREGGILDLLWRGKFSLDDLPLIAELDEKGVLLPARLKPRYLADPAAVRRIELAATTNELGKLVGGQS
jgi:uncharacterized protein (TIGR02421 family)